MADAIKSVHQLKEYYKVNNSEAINKQLGKMQGVCLIKLLIRSKDTGVGVQGRSARIREFNEYNNRGNIN